MKQSEMDKLSSVLSLVEGRGSICPALRRPLDRYELDVLEEMEGLSQEALRAALAGARAWFRLDDEAFEEYFTEAGEEAAKYWKGSPEVHAEQAAKQEGTTQDFVEALVGCPYLLDALSEAFGV
ncbi:MAG: hypothetical protein J0I77_01820 [Rudaea sp.]|uniref:hypothetical protein n=1 Tax=unclassified Rudaea TaxID=2627037 RepID=UPI0010F84535|nr:MULTISPECIES: hypothetical protein [unclassified Rudaea]MBN8884432.1 hypothetical protein [Rudaea sp.]